MWLQGFATYIGNPNATQDFVLENCNVVIDAQQFFFARYTQSELTRLTGGEYDKYANYLRSLLQPFQINNVKCYVVFKGGHLSETDLEKRITKFGDHIGDTVLTESDSYHPILTRNVAYQVLDELGMRYSVSEYERKIDVINLAMALRCPIISANIEFCFYPSDYVPHTTIVYEEGMLKCKIFRLKYFLQRHGIHENDFALFGTMLDQRVFPDWFFNKRLPELRCVSKRNTISTVLSLLRSQSDRFRKSLFSRINQEETDRFLQVERIIKQHLFYEGQETFLVKYTMSKGVEFDGGPSWFSKGVCMGRIAMCYVHLIKNRVLFGSWEIEDIDSDDSLSLSLKIIRYAYDLLTNYDGTNFTFVHREGASVGRKEITKEMSIAKPAMFTEDLFKNGWTDFSTLFDSFLKSESLDSEELKKIPSDASILIVSLVYFSRRSSKGLQLTYSVLLCYLLLNLSSFNDVPEVMVQFFTASDEELRNNLDRKILHPIIQFQYCLEHMNYLNTLCAANYAPSIYHKIVNCTFIYNILMKLEKVTNPRKYLESLLSPTSIIFTSFLNLFDLYEKLM